MTRLILTPTARLARSHASRYAAQQTANGATAWLPPKILSFPAWLVELRQSYLLASDDRRVPIGASQARILWQSLIDMDVFIGEPQVAALAEHAWRRIHEYDLQRPEAWRALDLSEDSRRFREWALRYQRACAERSLVDEWAFGAELPGLIKAGLVELPAAITLVGFDRPMTPLQAQIMTALATAGVSVESAQPAAIPAPLAEILETLEPDGELLAAARWARTRLEVNPNQQIAIVVPDLAARLPAVERLLRGVFDPPGLTLADSGPAAWHISLGAPLRQWPLVDQALLVLHLGGARITHPEARCLLGSPFLDGWSVESAARNQALARLVREAPWEVTPLELRRAAEQADAHILAAKLTTWHERRTGTPDSGWPSIWAARFQEELSALGFGFGRALDSREYQVLQRWHDLLEEFSALDVVIDRPIPRSAALALLRDRAAASVFREQNPGVPVEILGVEEALGSRFDAVWLTTLDNDHWPGAPRRDPLIPANLQAAVPGTTAEGALTEARQTLDGLLAAAPCVCGSYSRGSAEEARQPTALLAEAVVTPEAPEAPLRPAPLAPPIDDWRAPLLDQGATRGGTTLLTQQSACPFLAFAERRLGAIELTPPRPGLDAAQRGTVIHRALEHFWRGLSGRAELAALPAAAREARVRAAVDSAIEAFTARFRLTLTRSGIELERRRTARVLERWLEQELARADFDVAAQEQPITMEFAGLSLGGNIDRIDRLPDGQLLLIDYKTGRNTRSGWFPEPRIADPQLPAYAVAMDPPADAIAFARIRPEDLRFEGLARGDAGTSGITPLDAATHKFKELGDWEVLLTSWRTHLEVLAGSFRDGHAAVDPRNASVCTRCHLQAFCRIRERAPFEAPDADVVEGAGDE